MIAQIRSRGASDSGESDTEGYQTSENMIPMDMTYNEIRSRWVSYPGAIWFPGKSAPAGSDSVRISPIGVWFRGVWSHGNSDPANGFNTTKNFHKKLIELVNIYKFTIKPYHPRSKLSMQQESPSVDFFNDIRPGMIFEFDHYCNNYCSVSRWRPQKVDKRMVLEHTHGLFIT